MWTRACLLYTSHQHHMDEAAVLPSLLQAHLTDGLQEGLALNIAGGAAEMCIRDRSGTFPVAIVWHNLRKKSIVWK